jgi:hypothetical protein
MGPLPSRLAAAEASCPRDSRTSPKFNDFVTVNFPKVLTMKFFSSVNQLYETLGRE